MVDQWQKIPWRITLRSAFNGRALVYIASLRIRRNQAIAFTAGTANEAIEQAMQTVKRLCPMHEWN